MAANRLNENGVVSDPYDPVIVANNLDHYVKEMIKKSKPPAIVEFCSLYRLEYGYENIIPSESRLYELVKESKTLAESVYNCTRVRQSMLWNMGRDKTNNGNFIKFELSANYGFKERSEVNEVKKEVESDLPDNISKLVEQEKNADTDSQDSSKAS